MSESVDYYTKKITVIIYASIANFFIASYLSKKVEKYFLYNFDKDATDYKNIYALCMNISIIAVFAYILRQISETLPLPFKSDNFDPSRVKEVKASVLTAFTLFLFFGDEVKDFKNFLYKKL
tara:strand:+ start:3926 stop:4291 length:366 start_codon:yes stop_codon:yes gene_type:complete